MLLLWGDGESGDRTGVEDRSCELCLRRRHFSSADSKIQRGVALVANENGETEALSPYGDLLKQSSFTHKY